MSFDKILAGPICLLVRCSQDWSWRPPPLPFFDFWFVMDGRGRMDWEGGSAELRPGKVLVFPRGSRPHGTQDLNHPLQVFAAHFFPEGGDGPAPWPTPDDVLVHQFQDLSYAKGLARHAITWWRRKDDSSSLERWRHHLASLFGLVVEEQGNPGASSDERILSLLDQIRFSPEEDWSVARLAKLGNLSRSQLTRRFQKTTGVSPKEYVITQRLERACEYLRTTQDTLEVVAGRAGYRDVYFFARQFRERMGMPPGKWRSS